MKFDNYLEKKNPPKNKSILKEKKEKDNFKKKVNKSSQFKTSNKIKINQKNKKIIKKNNSVKVNNLIKINNLIKVKKEIPILIICFILLLILILTIMQLKQEETFVNGKSTSETTNMSESSDLQNKTSKELTKEELYQDDWYTNGVLDPQKITSKNALEQNTNQILVNKLYVLDKTYTPDVEEIEGQYLTLDAKKAYLEMKQQAQNDGITLTIGSSYRSYEEQEQLFDSYLNADEYSEVLTYSAYPGTSEHQTGLVIDFIEQGECDFDTCFEKTSSGIWLSENAANYGFILRFPQNKEDITGYMYEPWHYRYVGREVAQKIEKEKITLEEYILV